MAGQTASAVVGYACEFMDTIPKELQTECSICLHVLRDPHLLDCCGYRFCKRCIERVLSEFKSCPLCNHRLPNTVADRQLSRTLREKRVRCTHKGEGCKWVGELSALNTHLDVTKRVDGCRFKFMQCHYCSVMLRFDLIESHESKCRKKPVVCEYCNVYQCLQHELPQHWENCTLYPIICPKGCGAKITRISLDKHYKYWCPLSIVECDFAYAGCSVRVQRKLMKSHLDEAVKDHLDLMTKRFSAMKVAYEDERDTSKGLREELKEVREYLEDVKDELKEVKQELQDERATQRYRDSTRDQEKSVLKKLCSLRQEQEFDRARDQVLVYDLPPQATYHMVKSLFGQHGPVYAAQLYSTQFGDFIAVIEYQNSDSIFKLFQKYNSIGMRLLGYQLKCIRLEC